MTTWYIPNRLAWTVEVFQHPLHIAMQLAVFAILHKRRSTGESYTLLVLCLIPACSLSLALSLLALSHTQHHSSLSLTDSWWPHGLLERWLHRSCWHPAWTSPASASFPDCGWSEPTPSSCSCATAKNNHKYCLMELVKFGEHTCKVWLKTAPVWWVCVPPSRTGFHQRPAASSCGPSHSSAADLEQTSGIEHHYGSGGTWCCTQGCQLLSLLMQWSENDLSRVGLILTTLPHGRQCHPTSHSLRKPTRQCHSPT